MVVMSSAHIAPGNVDYFAHNSRESHSNSQIFFDEKNEIWNNVKRSKNMFDKALAKRKGIYTKRTGQKLQKNTVVHLSIILNLEKRHTMQDILPIKKELEKSLGTKVTQMAIHRDEGKLIHKESKEKLVSGTDFFLNHADMQLYFDNAYTKKIDMNEWIVEKNYHAHMEMLGLDHDGMAIKRNKLNRVYLQQLQTFVADILKMPRGTQRENYTKDEINEIISYLKPKSEYAGSRAYGRAFNQVARELGYFKPKRKRLDTHEFKANAKVKNDAEKKTRSILQKKYSEELNAKENRWDIFVQGVKEKFRDYRKQMKKLKQQMDLIIQERLVRAEEHLLNILEENSLLQNKVADLKQENDQKIINLEGANREYKKKYKELDILYTKEVQKSTNIEEANKELNNKISDLEKANLQYVANIQSKEEELNIAKQSLKNKEKENDDLKKEIDNLKGFVYSDQNEYKGGEKTGRKLTYRRLSEIRKKQINKLEQSMQALENTVNKLEPTGYEIEGYMVSKEVYDSHEKLKYKINVLEEKQDRAEERIESRDRMYDQTIEQYKEEITNLEALAYTGEEYPVEFDENDNPIKVEKETWKEVASSLQEDVSQRDLEIKSLNEELMQLVPELDKPEIVIEEEESYADIELEAKKKENENLTEVIYMMRDYDIPKSALEGDIEDIVKTVKEGEWKKGTPPQKNTVRNKSRRGFKPGR